MSRPFSYNDENFTVIGNVCFGHILAKPTSANEIICEIPAKGKLIIDGTLDIECNY